MKKVFLTYAAIAALAITSCQDNGKSDTTEETKTEATTETDEKTTTTESSDSVPKFSDSDVQAYVDSYEEYISAYSEAAESKDIDALADLATKGQELGTMAQDISEKLTGKDGERLATYMSEKAKEIQELSKKMME